MTAFIGVALNVMLPLVPAFRAMFSLTELSGGQWATVLLLSLGIVPFGELYKWVMRLLSGRVNKRKRYSLARESTR